MGKDNIGLEHRVRLPTHRSRMSTGDPGILVPAQHRFPNFVIHTEGYRLILSGGTHLVERLCAGVNPRIIVHEDSDSDAPLVFVQLFHAHYVPNPLAMNRVFRAKIQSHDDVHSHEIVLRGRNEV